MYCKHCGKQITDDSSFCQYCGGKVMDVSLAQESNIVQPANNENNLVENTPEVVLVTKDANPIQIEVSEKSKDNSSVIANEIVGNLKMVAIAAILFVIYMIGFILIHQKDIKQYDYDTHESFFGESCYDPNILSGNWVFHWEKHYYQNLYFELYKRSPFDLNKLTPEQCLKEAECLEEVINKRKAEIAKKRKASRIIYFDDEWLELFDFEIARERAKAEAARDIRDWNDTINNGRRWGYEKDLKKNAIYSAIISLLVMILGRYLVKGVKWINENKTT